MLEGHVNDTVLKSYVNRLLERNHLECEICRKPSREEFQKLLHLGKFFPQAVRYSLENYLDLEKNPDNLLITFSHQGEVEGYTYSYHDLALRSRESYYVDEGVINENYWNTRVSAYLFAVTLLAIPKKYSEMLIYCEQTNKFNQNLERIYKKMGFHQVEGWGGKTCGIPLARKIDEEIVIKYKKILKIDS